MAIIETLSKKFKRTNKTALILAGGGLTGWMYEIGALTALNDLFENDFTVCDFDIFVGTSAGASIASLVANNVNPEDILNSILSNDDAAFNFNRKDIYNFAWSEAFASIKKLSISFFPLTKYYYKNRKRFSMLDFIYLLQENLPSGIFSIKNLERYVESSFEKLHIENEFSRLKKELYIPAIDIDTGNFTIFGDGNNSDVLISKAIAASSAIPILFHPVRVKGKDYVDGSVGKVAHLNVAIEKGASFILTINPVMPINNDRKTICIPSFHGKCVGLKEKGLSFIADQVLRVNTATKLNLGINRYRSENPDIDFILLQPPRTEVEMFSYNIMSLQAKSEVLNYGYFSTVRMIMKQFEQIKTALSRQGIKVSLEKFKEENHIRWQKAHFVQRERKELYESLRGKGKNKVKKRRFFFFKR